MCTDDTIRSGAPAPATSARPRRASTPGTFVLGLVGPAGGGKSTVARALAQDGATVALETLTLQNEGWVVTYAVADTSGYPSVLEPTAPVIAGVAPPA